MTLNLAWKPYQNPIYTHTTLLKKREPPSISKIPGNILTFRRQTVDFGAQSDGITRTPRRARTGCPHGADTGCKSEWWTQPRLYFTGERRRADAPQTKNRPNIPIIVIDVSALMVYFEQRAPPSSSVCAIDPIEAALCELGRAVNLVCQLLLSYNQECTERRWLDALIFYVLHVSVLGLSTVAHK